MPRPRFQKLSPEKRGVILEAAGREFAAHGFEQASLNAIIAAAGVSKGAFYYYFDDKLDLFATVLEGFEELYHWREAMRAPGLTADTYWLRLRELSDRAFADTRDRPWLLALAKVFYDLPRELRETERLARVLAGVEETVLDFLRRGQALGVVRDDLPLSLLTRLLVAIDRAFTEWMPAHLSAMSPDELVALEVASLGLLERIARPDRSATF